MLAGASLSGHERNHVFLNESGSDFRDVSGLSGLDHPGDSRSFAILDYDRDGWQDLALVNANAPLLQLFRNRIGESGGSGGMVAVRFEGGNHSGASGSGWSARDGYGARVVVDAAGRQLVREHRSGEGLAAQNSATLLVGVGDAPAASSAKADSGKLAKRAAPPPSSR